MKPQRKIIEIDEELCTGCGNCIIQCAEGALEIVSDKAKLVSDKYCDGLGACLGECPTGALKIIEREADEFDEEAVEGRLHALKQEEAQAQTETLPCGCPSTRMQTFQALSPCQAANEPAVHATSSQSELTHWPVQIRLVPPNAPFLRNAHLLVAADCTPFAYASFHRDFMQGKVVLVGCPKLDDKELYLEKFSELFRVAGVRSVTTVDMEVPCCQSLPVLVKMAMEKAGKTIPMENVIISVQGEILKRVKQVA